MPLLLRILAGLPHGFSGMLWSAERALRRLAVHPILAPASVGIVVLAICVMDAALFGMPRPGVHDEFSYLLGADTFAHGRLSNPPHPMWRYLEEFHVLEHPTRASKYPAGMALVLAFGIAVFGHPIVGVWLVSALACATTVWALRALVPAYWAWLGGMLLALHPIMHLWSTNYWGGSLAVLGGALALGAFLRLREHVRPRSALLFGFGLALLAVARPFEGAVLGAMLGIALAVASLGPRGVPLSEAVLRLWLPIGGCLAVAGLGIGYYDAVVAGNPWLLPYVAYTAQHDSTPLFLWQSLPKAPSYDYEIFRQMADWEYQQYAEAQTAVGFLSKSASRILSLLSRLLLPQGILVISLLVLPATLARSGVGRLLAVMTVIFLAVLCSETYFQLHYAAPFFPVMFALLILCLRRLSVARFGQQRLGRLGVRLGFVIALLVVPFARPAPEDTAAQKVAREAIAAELEQLPGKHLVIVRYASHHNPHFDWVHNGADIDASPIVWAHDRGDGDRELVDYFRDRTVWILDADRESPAPILARSICRDRAEAADAIADLKLRSDRIWCPLAAEHRLNLP